MEYKIYILRTVEDASPRYVGITSGNLKTRLNKHIHDIKRDSCKNLHKKNWLSKYKGYIIIEQIDVASSIDEMKQKEKLYIRDYRMLGYNLLNLTDGGDGTYGYKHNKDTIEKMSGVNNHRYGKKHTDEWKNKMSGRVPHNKGIKTGIPSWNKGIPMSDEVKEKQRIVKLGKKDSEETRLKKSMNSKSHLRKRPIECLIDNNWVEFTSAKDAAINLNLNRTKIILVCNGKRNHTGGYIFRYKNITVE